MPGHPLDQNGSGAVYIHIPYCLTKCDYCAFVSHPTAADTDFAPYIAAIGKHARLLAARQPFSTCHSIFIGGGTPTIIPATLLADMLGNILGLYDSSASAEITIEANPNTITRQSLATLRGAGVNRLSIGVQSFSDQMLTAIGRSHSAAEALAGFKMARAAGFTNINLDLIYGLPKQDSGDWHRTLTTALKLGPEHISIYELMIEAPSVFASRRAEDRLQLPDTDRMIQMDDTTAQLTKEHGYKRYEISNYGRDKYRCRHNINYWQNGSYIGLGAAAVSNFNGIRTTNTSNPAVYIDKITRGNQAIIEAEILPRPASFRESIIMGLRMLDGVDIAALRARYNIWAPEYYGDTLTNLIKNDLILYRNNYLQLTAKGLRLANLVMAELV